MLRVGVLGAGGRMGIEVCKAVAGDPELDLVAAVDPRLAGIDLRQVTGLDADGLQIAGHVEALELAEADVAVDFTVAGAAREHLRWCADHGVHVVLGTTGLDASDLADVSQWFSDSKANCLIAANFAIGAVLML